MEILVLLIMTVGCIWSTYKLIDGFTHIRKYSAKRFVLHALICSVTSMYILFSIILWFIQRL
ncbi:membrane protein [Bacillus phage Chotacabras]|nr:membrane protein [Bacillus phage Chotacabras]